jgi:hypothetical protein
MATGASIQAKIKAVLAKLQATPRVVKFRTVVQTGGNTRLGILGIAGTLTVTETAITPQPAAELLVAEELTASGVLLMPGDWRFIFSGDMAEADFRSKQLLFGTEILSIVHVEPYVIYGVNVGWGVVGRTVQTR